MPSHKYKLIYFDMRGGGELIRLLFHAAGVPFEDVRLSPEDFALRKPSFPFGQVPVLEVDGKVYAQRSGIAIYLATEFGFHGETTLECLKVNEVLFHLMDLLALAQKIFFERDEARKAQFLKEAVEEKLPRGIQFLVNLLQKSGTGYFVGSKITLADIAVFDFCQSMEGGKLIEIAKCPDEIQKLVVKVSKHPKLVDYLAQRK